MATVTTNSLVEGISGMVGNLVFKNMRGKTFVARSPQRPKVQSPQQKENRSKFRAATAWAKEVLDDPERKAYYKKKAQKLQLPNAYTAAITDYMRKPTMVVLADRDESSTCIVSKKGFVVKHVKVVMAGAAKPRQSIDVADGVCTIHLGKEEVTNLMSITATDEAGNGYDLLVRQFG